MRGVGRGDSCDEIEQPVHAIVFFVVVGLEREELYCSADERRHT